MPATEALHYRLRSNFEEIYLLARDDVRRIIPQQNEGYLYQLFGEIFNFCFDELDGLREGVTECPHAKDYMIIIISCDCK